MLKRKGILVVLLALILIIIIGYISVRFYVNYEAKKIMQLEKDNLYLSAKCLEFCPYKIVNNISQFNFECQMACEKENTKKYQLDERNLFYSLIYDRYKDMKIKSENLIFNYQYSQCVPKLQRGNKSCLANWLDNLKKYSNAQFVEPVYENVTLEIKDLVCSDDGIDIVLNLEEGNIDGTQFKVRKSNGNSYSVERMTDFSGLKEFVISKDEYEKNGENVSMVQIAYIKEGDISPIVSSKDC